MKTFHNKSILRILFSEILYPILLFPVNYKIVVKKSVSCNIFHLQYNVSRKLINNEKLKRAEIRWKYITTIAYKWFSVLVTFRYLSTACNWGGTRAIRQQFMLRQVRVTRITIAIVLTELRLDITVWMQIIVSRSWRNWTLHWYKSPLIRYWLLFRP